MKTPRLIKLLPCLTAVLTVISPAKAADVVKADNADNLNVSTSWSGGVVPTTSDVAVWNSTVTAANTTLLAANTNWSGIRIVNPGGLVTVNATSGNATTGATNTIGAAGINMADATADLTLGAPVGLLGSTAQGWIIGAGRTLTLSGGLIRNTRAMLDVDNSAGGVLNIPAGTASTVLNFSTINKTDFGALDSGKNFVGAASVITYTPNPVGAAANSASLAGTVTWIDVVNSNPAIAPSAFRLSNTATTSGIRFNTPNANGIDWVVDANSRNLNLSSATILVTPNAGNRNVQINTSSGNLRLGTGSELMFAQHNTAGDLVINGQITQAGAGSFVTKMGAGRVILNSAFNNYSGGTFVEQGTVLVNGVGVITNGAATVNNGATLGGSGRAGAVTVASGGRLAPGNVGVGALTVQGALTLSAGTTYLDFYAAAVSTTNTTPLLLVTNNALTVNGTVNVSILAGSLSVGQYPLLRWSNAIPSGTFSAFSLAAIAPHVSAFLSNNTASSSIDLVVTAVNQPLRWAAGNGVWDINTTANWKDLLGATTTYQQTSFAADAVVFEDSLSGASPISVTINSTLTPPSTTVSNAAKSYTLTGSGSIAGTGSLTKQGAGTLTLETINTFTGPVDLSGGTTVFSSLANLGAGAALNFNGGTLQYNGNADDISVRTVTINSGGATINSGASIISFANPIGNNGAGGLTKTGSGSLTLTGTNRYSGNTLINVGTLALGFSSYISNSPAIIVSSGATLDVTGSGLITLASGVSQKLAGIGSVNGSVAAPTGTTITPATNSTIGTLTINSGDLTFNGATYAADMTPSTRDLIVVNGSLTLTSGSLQLNVSGTLANGSYTLIQYSGGLSGAAGNLTVSGYSPVGKSVTLSDATPGQINLIIADSASDVLTWSGSASADWDVIGSLNWLKGANPWAYTNGSFVTFDDSGAAQPNISLQAAVVPGSVTVNNPTVNYTFSDPSGTGVGKITGATSITKSGAGTLTINTVNNNTGPLVINAGTVQVGDNGNNGALGTGNITNNSALVFAQTDSRIVSGAVSGSGSLTQQGNAGTTLTLSGAQTYTGPTTINSGILQVGAGTANGVMASASITNNGTLILNSTTSWTLAAPVTGTGGLTKQATNTLTLGGGKSYTGRTTVEGGKLILTAADQLKGELRVQSSGTADINGFDQTLIGISSTPTFSGGRLVNNSGSAQKVVTITNTTDFDCSIVIADNDGTGGTVAVVKDGPATLQWRGNNTYSGGTTIKDGSVRVTTGTAFGTGGVTMLGGRLIIGSITVANPINLVSNVIIEAQGNGTYTGLLTGTNTLDFQIDGNETFTWNGAANQLAGFSGTILIRPGNGFFRFNGSRGSAAATFDLTGSIATINSASVGVFELGALVGDGGSFLGANAGSSFMIGGKNLSTEYAGTLNAVNNTLIKVGTGTLTLSGLNSFTGSTIVSNGVLALSGSAELDDSPTISVKSGAFLDVTAIGGVLNLGNLVSQTFSGSGTIRGSVVQNANSQIVPGDSIGILTVTNTVTLGGTNVMEINRTNGVTADKIVAQQGFIVSGTPYVVIQNIGPTNFTVGDKFTVFSQPVSGVTLSGTLPTLPCAGLSWVNKLAVDGSLEVGGSPCVNLTPTNITSTVVGNTLDLQWPADRTGWTLQTNAVSVANPGAWFAYPGSAATNRVIITINPNAANVFFRLVYP